ncbi:unnamed protein product [marine sediment metagenome]|uniref:Uncharacterized protein n=1 Tax=marine sediment metagenome TaxID=412755 RepID=X1DBV2_9ZZZZ
MPRGRLLKTKVKEAFKIAEAAARGKASGEAKAHKKKDLTESFKEHIGKILDRSDPKNMADAVIVAGLAYLGYEKPTLLVERWFCRSRTS